MDTMFVTVNKHGADKVSKLIIMLQPKDKSQRNKNGVIPKWLGYGWKSSWLTLDTTAHKLCILTLPTLAFDNHTLDYIHNRFLNEKQYKDQLGIRTERKEWTLHYNVTAWKKNRTSCKDLNLRKFTQKTNIFKLSPEILVLFSDDDLSNVLITNVQIIPIQQMQGKAFLKEMHSNLDYTEKTIMYLCIRFQNKQSISKNS